MKNNTRNDKSTSYDESPDHEVRSKKFFILVPTVSLIIGGLTTIFVIRPIDYIAYHYKNIKSKDTRLRSIISIAGFIFIAWLFLSVISMYAPSMSIVWTLLLVCIYTPPWIMDALWSVVRPQAERISELK